MMRSMFADQPYSPVTRTHGESERRPETTHLSTLSSSTFFLSFSRNGEFSTARFDSPVT